MICIHCEEEFDPKATFHRKGKINECGWCAGRDVPKYIAINDAANKSGSGLVIFREPKQVAVFGSMIRRQCAAGFNANLPLGSTTSTVSEEWAERIENEDKNEMTIDRVVPFWEKNKK